MDNLPPREPRDLRNRGNRPGSGPSGNRPQFQPGDPRQQPPGQPQQYPPEGLPPAPPPQLGGQPRQPDSYNDYGDSYGQGQNIQTGLPATELPQLGKKKSGNSLGLPSISEHRIEYLAWGSVVLLMGCSVIMMTLSSDAAIAFMRVGAPIISGLILLASGIIQRIVYNYQVSTLSWGAAIFALAFGSSQAIALLADSALFYQFIYFIGFLIIISGFVMILQVFRSN